MYWQAFDVLEPIGMLRENAFQANIAKSVFDTQLPNHELNLSNFLLWHEEAEPTRNDVVANVKAKLDSLCD